MDVIFVLVEPKVPENVGFCCRGLKTLGFSELRIVGQGVHREKGALNTAYGSHDFLENIRVSGDLKSAVGDCDLVIGTTARDRVGRYDYLAPEELKQTLATKSGLSRVAIVFGSETNGLSNDDIAVCDLLSTIPLKTDYPSLNLAQAVLIYAYELSKVPFDDSPSTDEGLQQEILSNVDKLVQVVELDKYPIKAQRIRDRISLMGSNDSSLALGLIKKVLKKLKGNS